MKYKPNWDEAREHWTALWEGRYVDRPCMTVVAGRPDAPSMPQAATPEDYWLNADFLVKLALARVQSHHWCGEAMPSILLMAGWCICYGATPRFEWSTIWHEPVAVDWDNPPPLELDWNDPWLKRYEAVYRAVRDAAGWDDFMLGTPCTLPGNDILVALIGNAEFLPALIDHPEWMRAAIRTLGENKVALRRHFAAIAAETHAFPWGNPQWMTFWAPEPFVSTQSDVSCMLSPAMFDEFILPELDMCGEAFGAMWYHLDGWRAAQHLPTLLSRPYLKVMQFIPEPDFPPNGPEWLHLYRRIQAAGKIVHISVAPQFVEPLVRALDPALLVLDTWAAGTRDADDLLESAKRWVRVAT